jgi:hypothetical protein
MGRWPNCTPNPAHNASRPAQRLLDSRVEPAPNATDFFVESMVACVGLKALCKLDADPLLLLKTKIKNSKC